jgi:hypothetical protein
LSRRQTAGVPKKAIPPIVDLGPKSPENLNSTRQAAAAVRVYNGPHSGRGLSDTNCHHLRHGN